VKISFDADFFFLLSRVFWSFHYAIKIEKYLFVTGHSGNDKWTMYKDFNFFRSHCKFFLVEAKKYCYIVLVNSAHWSEVTVFFEGVPASFNETSYQTLMHCLKT
jgi:hypothetical protein